MALVKVTSVEIPDFKKELGHYIVPDALSHLKIEVTWQNTAGKTLIPGWRWDLRPSGAFQTWVEGGRLGADQWDVSDLSVPAGSTRTSRTWAYPPPHWGKEKTEPVDVKLMVRNEVTGKIEQVWDAADFFHIKPRADLIKVLSVHLAKGE